MSSPCEPDFLSDTERRCLERFRAGERAAFQSLLRPQLEPLERLARRLCGDPHWADDLLQETLVRAFRGLATFEGRSRLRTWLFRIMTRLANDPKRWRNSERAIALDEVEIPVGVGPSPDEPAMTRELGDRLAEALERLTQRQRAAFHLRAVEGLDYRAVAESLGCTAAAARMLVLEARRKVMRRLGRHLEP